MEIGHDLEIERDRVFESNWEIEHPGFNQENEGEKMTAGIEFDREDFGIVSVREEEVVNDAVHSLGIMDLPDIMDYTAIERQWNFYDENMMEFSFFDSPDGLNWGDGFDNSFDFGSHA